MFSRIYTLARYIVPAYTVIIWAVTLVHLVQGIALAVDAHAVSTTTIIHMVRSGIPIPALVAWYLVGVVAATIGLLMMRRGLGFHIAMWFPQQLLAIWGATGSIQAMFLGAYLDGTDVATAHIVADQAVYPILAIAHFIGFILWQTLGREYDQYREDIVAQYKAVLHQE